MRGVVKGLVAATVVALAAVSVPAATAAPVAAAGPAVLAATPDVLFPPTPVGGSAPNRTIVVRNLGTSPVTLASHVDAPATALFWTFDRCLGVTLAPGGTCAVRVRYQPTSTRADTATVTLASADGTQTVDLNATGQPVARVRFDEHDAGFVPRLGATVRQTLHLRNVGTTPVAVQSTDITPPTSELTVAVDGCTGTVLQPDTTCPIALDGTPAQPYTNAAAVLRAQTTGGAAEVPLSVEAAFPFVYADTDLSFDYQVVGTTSARQDEVITNATAEALPMTIRIPAVLQYGFRAIDDCSGVTLAPGASCRVGFTFTPTAPGSVGLFPPYQVNGAPHRMHLTGLGVASRPTSKALRISPQELQFDAYDVDQPRPHRTVTVTNEASSPQLLNGSVTADGVEVVSDGCSGRVLAPGASCPVVVAPPAGPGCSGVVALKWGAGAARVTVLYGALAQLGDVGPTQLGPVMLGETATATFRVVDVGSAPVTLTDPPPLGFPATDTVTVTSNGCLGVTLQPGDSCPVTLAVTPNGVPSTPPGYTPQSAVVIRDWDGLTGVLYLYYQPQSWLQVDVTALDLGMSPTTTPPPPATATLTNVSDAARTVRTCQVTGPYLVSACVGQTIAAGGTLALTVRPGAGANGASTGSVTVRAADGSTVQFTVSGGPTG